MIVMPISLTRIQLADLLAQMKETGEEVIITIHGDPAGKLVLPTAKDKRMVKQAMVDDRPAEFIK